MKRIILAAAAALAIFGLGACVSEPMDRAHNSRNSVNWEGVYTGTIPAADGPGINVQLTLDVDETYEISYEYIDKSESFVAAGKFTWDESEGIIMLDAPDLPPYYKVGEGILIQLDMRGKPISGGLAERYILRKLR